MSSRGFKILLIAKLLAFYAILNCNQVHAQNNPLKTKITLEKSESSLGQLLEEITQNFGVAFSYNPKLINNHLTKGIDVQSVELDRVLTRVLSNTPLKFKASNGVVIIFEEDIGENKGVLEDNNIYLEGYVSDTLGRPIPGVNVFLSNTSKGTFTDENGYYNFVSLPIKPYEIVFSHISHHPVVKVISSKGDTAISIAMTEKVDKLQEVVIAENKEERERYLKFFESEFLGKTPNAKRCKILNPEVLDFTYDPNTDFFQVTAQDLIIVQNLALGYTVSHLLILFEHRYGKTKYVVKSKFEELITKNVMSRTIWERNKKKAFFGSFEHFLTALQNNRLNSEGFEIELAESLDKNAERTPVGYSDIFKSENSQDILKFDGYLYITYNKYEDSAYKHYINNRVQSLLLVNRDIRVKNHLYYQTSVLKIIEPKTYAVMKSQTLKDPLSIDQEGYWSWKRTADMLPIEFAQEYYSKKAQDSKKPLANR